MILVFGKGSCRYPHCGMTSSCRGGGCSRASSNGDGDGEEEKGQ